MAQRWRGPFSPRDAGPAAVPPHPLAGRTGWITAAATPLLLTAFWQDPAGLVTNLAGFGLMLSAMTVTRAGLAAEAAYDSRRVARRPALPRKAFGAALTGLGLAVGAWAPDALVGAGLLGAAGAALHVLAFGRDPMRDKGMDGVDAFQQDRAARMIAEGQAHLDGMRQAILRTGDRRLEARVAMFEATAHSLFRQVEQNPGDLGPARRYLGVYLLGAREATARFADLYAQTRDARALADWEALLTDLESTFAARTRQFIEGGRTDLDIQMAVLRERLLREGVSAPALGDAADPPTMDALLGKTPARAPR